MPFTLISGTFSQDISHKLSIILKAPIYKMLSRQSSDRKLHVVAAENFVVDQIFIVMSSVFCSSCLNDALMELLLFINFCKLSSNARLTVGSATKC